MSIKMADDARRRAHLTSLRGACTPSGPIAQTTRAQMTIDSTSEARSRVDLAAAFRLAERFGWHEAVANHFSVAASADGRQFLMNPRWRHFSMIRASEGDGSARSNRKALSRSQGRISPWLSLVKSADIRRIFPRRAAKPHVPSLA